MTNDQCQHRRSAKTAERRMNWIELSHWTLGLGHSRANALNLFARHAAVRLEDARGSKLAEFVADHVFGDVNGGEDLAVVDAERVADEIGCDRRAAGAGSDWFLCARLSPPPPFFSQERGLH